MASNGSTVPRSPSPPRYPSRPCGCSIRGVWLGITVAELNDSMRNPDTWRLEISN